jgi:hypothetical protein
LKRVRKWDVKAHSSIRHAETLIDEETKLTIFNVGGKPLIITTVLPQEK